MLGFVGARGAIDWDKVDIDQHDSNVKVRMLFELVPRCTDLSHKGGLICLPHVSQSARCHKVVTRLLYIQDIDKSFLQLLP